MGTCDELSSREGEEQPSFELESVVARDVRRVQRATTDGPAIRWAGGAFSRGDHMVCEDGTATWRCQGRLGSSGAGDQMVEKEPGASRAAG